MVRLVAALRAVLIASGCSASGSAAPQGFTEGSSIHTISVGGVDRSYRLYIPADLPPSAPLVVTLHGSFGSAEQAERSYGWNQLADSAKFVVAYPDGVGRAWNANGGCCGRPGREGLDDVGFITAGAGDISESVGIGHGPGLRDRYQQRRHDGLRPGLQHQHLRQDRARLRHAA